jgi:hypothetical protein
MELNGAAATNPFPPSNRKAEDGGNRQRRNDPGLLVTGRGRYALVAHDAAGWMAVPSAAKPECEGLCAPGSVSQAFAVQNTPHRVVDSGTARIDSQPKPGAARCTGSTRDQPSQARLSNSVGF